MSGATRERLPGCIRCISGGRSHLSQDQIAYAEQSSVLILTEISLCFASHPKHVDKTVGLTRFPDLDQAHL